MNYKRQTLFLVYLFAILFLVQSNSNYYSTSKIEIQDNEKLNSVTLRILTRYDTTIASTIRSGFLASQIASDRNITDVQFLSTSTDEGWKTLVENPSMGVDLLWGGDSSLMNKMDDWNLIKHIDNTTLINLINMSVPDSIASTELKSFNTSGNIIWLADTISSYGFTVNHIALYNFGLPEPNTWEDLASPAFYTNPTTHAISMTDAPLSGYNTKIYQIILQTFGWEEGWSILTRMAGNAGFYPGSVAARAAVVSEEVAVALTVDHYGIIARREHPHCEFIAPEGQSVIIPSLIAIAKNVDNQEAAEAFIEYIVSPEGQNEWMQEGLDRLPVNEDAFQTTYGQTRMDLYSLYNDTLDNIGIVFNNSLAKANLATTMYYFHNTITEKHDILRLTWDKMISALEDSSYNMSYFSDLTDRLGETCMTAQESIDWNEQYQTDINFASAKDTEWKNFAQDKYITIYWDLMGYIDDIYEDNDAFANATIIADEGFFNLYYKDVDYYNITLENGYTYNFTVDFNQVIIDLNMYLLPHNYSGNIEDILAESSTIISPENIIYIPEETGEYILLIEHYTIDPEEVITPANYTLTIEKTVTIPENTKNIAFMFYPFVLMVIILFSKKKRHKK